MACARREVKEKGKRNDACEDVCVGVCREGRGDTRVQSRGEISGPVMLVPKLSRHLTRATSVLKSNATFFIRKEG